VRRYCKALWIKALYKCNPFTIWRPTSPLSPQIHSKSLFAAADEPPKALWSGWLACVGGDPDYVRSLPEDFVCLPLFCRSGAAWLSPLVEAWFRRTFDCCFGPLEINAVSLQWLAALWTDCRAHAGVQPLKLVWSLPVEPPLEVTYAVHPQDAWELWRSVRRPLRERADEEEDGSVGIEEVEGFIKGLQSHFYRHFRLELSAGQLTQVSTALGSAKHVGRLKVRPAEASSVVIIIIIIMKIYSSIRHKSALILPLTSSGIHEHFVIHGDVSVKTLSLAFTIASSFGLLCSMSEDYQ